METLNNALLQPTATIVAALIGDDGKKAKNIKELFVSVYTDLLAATEALPKKVPKHQSI